MSRWNNRFLMSIQTSIFAVGLLASLGANAGHTFNDSEIRLPSPLTLQLNFHRELSFEAHTSVYFEERPANRPVCGQPRREDTNMIVPPGLVYRDGWTREGRWTVLSLQYLASTCFSGGRQVLCWSDIPYEQRPRTGDGFQSFSALICEVYKSTRPSINEACRYPMIPGEVEMNVTTLKQTISTHDRTRRSQISVSFSQSEAGREKRLNVNVRCWRPTNDLRPITMDDILHSFGPALTVR